MAVSPNIFLSKKYGIRDGNMRFSASCATNPAGTRGHIAFDYLGRPRVRITTSTTPDDSTLMGADCNITLQFDDTSIPDAIITVERETGRVYLAQ